MSVSLILDDEFIQYCELNNIEDIEKFAREIFNRGFTILKYGEKPQIKEKKVVTPSKVVRTNVMKDNNNLYDE
ncbi:MAG TPA: hypothetical protein PK698_02225 [Bacilli bacterium]|nr:hypothetical protein [Bacilli bacterium]